MIAAPYFRDSFVYHEYFKNKNKVLTKTTGYFLSLIWYYVRADFFAGLLIALVIIECLIIQIYYLDFHQ